jgi:hypothetical protein
MTDPTRAHWDRRRAYWATKDKGESVSRFKDYVEVKDRIPLFWQRHPEGAVRTDMVRFEGEEVVFCAYLFAHRDDDKPIVTGYAHEVFGSSNVNKTSALENCETSAIGRALANMGITGPTGKEPRPSREEMQKTERAAPAKAEPKAKAKESDGPPATEKQIGFIEKLAKSHHLTAKEVTRLRRALADGMSKQQATDTLDWLTKQIGDREAAAIDAEQAEEQETLV